jgi:hypothetical protein
MAARIHPVAARDDELLRADDREARADPGLAAPVPANRHDRADAPDQLPAADTIGTTLFYGWGFGLWGKVGPAVQLVMAFAIFFIIQVPLSTFWFRHFEYGALEYVWRLGTYGRRAAVVVTAPAA